MPVQQPGDSSPARSAHRGRRRRRSSQHEEQTSGVPAVPNHPLETAVEIVLAAVLAFAPFAFGAVEGWSQLIAFSLVALLCACFFLHLLLDRNKRVVGTWAYVPIVLFLLLIVFQLIPIPMRLAGLISPATAAYRTKLLGDLPDGGNILQHVTLTFYPAATRRDLRVLLAAAAVFIVVVNTYRRQEQIRRLLLTIVAIGAAAVLLALAQDVTRTTQIYWKGPDRRGLANAGPFLSYSAFGQFVNLSIGAALGLLLVEMHKIFQPPGPPGTTPTRPLLDRRHLLAWLLGAFIALAVIAVFLSGSRGAMIGLLVALGLVAATLSGARGLEGNGWLIAPLIVIVCAAALFFGPAAVFERFSTLEKSAYYADRWQIAKDLTAEWKQFPIVGTGLGTHEVIYPMFDHSSRLDTATHAENEYAQTMEETGAIGLMLLLAFAAIIWHHYIRAARNADPPMRLACVGLGLGLAAIQVHSLSDFGQHLPADACLTAACCGLLIALSRLRQVQRQQLRAMGLPDPAETASSSHRSSPRNSRRSSRPSAQLVLHSAPSTVSATAQPSASGSGRTGGGAAWRWIWRGGMLAGVAIIAFWQVHSAFNDYRAESHWNTAYGLETYLTTNRWDAPNSTYTTIINETAAACSFAPDDVRYRYSLSAYRWHAISRVRDAGTNAVIYRPAQIGFARGICRELEGTRALCPTYSHTLLLQGEIEFLLLAEPLGPGHIRTAFQLARCDQTAAGMTARLDATEAAELAVKTEYNQVMIRENQKQYKEDLFRFLDSGGNFMEMLGGSVEDVLAINTDAAATADFSAQADVSGGKRDELWKQCETDFRRFLELGGNFREVIDVCIVQNHRPELALKLAHGKVEQLKEAASALDPIDPAMAAKARADAFEAMKALASRPDTPGSVLVELATQEQANEHYPAAIVAYRKALANDYGNIEWHLQLASLLLHEKAYPEALHEARACQHLGRNDKEVTELLARVMDEQERAQRPIPAAPATDPTTAPSTSPATAVTQPPATGTTPINEQ